MISQVQNGRAGYFIVPGPQDLYPSQDVNLSDVPSDSLRILLDTSTRRSLAAITKSADLPDQFYMKAESQCLSTWQSRIKTKPRNDPFVVSVREGRACGH